MAPGLLVDLSAGGELIGLEVIAPAQVTVGDVNKVLTQFNIEPVEPEELAPLLAA